MEYNSLLDLASRKAALKAELDMHAKEIKKLKQQLLSPVESAGGSNGKKGFLDRLDKKNVISTAISVFDGAWFAWKLYKKFKK